MRIGELARRAAVLARRGAEPPAAPETAFHLTNGDSTARTLRRTELRGPVLAWRDALHEGPIPPGDDATVREARARFLVETGWAARPEEVAEEFERRDRALLDALADGREVVLWFEHDLYDQLQLVQALALVARAGVPADSARLICIDRFPGRPAFAGLGELDERELASLWDLRRPVDEALLAAAAEAWDALRAPDPLELERIARRRRSPLSFVPAALERLLEELPAVGEGLGRTERQLLEAVRDGAATPVDAFRRAWRAEEAPFLGDTWAWFRLHELSTGDRRLVSGLPLAPPRGEAAVFAHAPVALTETGRAVLAGDADRVALVGIDRWLGGTHVVGPGPWRWDRASRRVVA